MKEVILDTDIGCDCDDAVAIALLIKLSRSGKCFFDTVTTSTAREGATACIKAIAGYYGYDVKNLGKMSPPPLECDSQDYYAQATAKKYGTNDSTLSSVTVLRKKLSQVSKKVTFITIGPLTALARFLKSGADGISPLTGQQLFDEKVDKIYIMGGGFSYLDNANNEAIKEWNIIQDIESAQYAVSNIKCEAVFSPSEVGGRIFSGNCLKKEAGNPAWYCMAKFAGEERAENYSRQSWDPVTVYLAVMGITEPFYRSQRGWVNVEEDGVTSFKADNDGKHSYIKIADKDISAAEKIINGILEN